jgi:hypothetical protein
MKILIGCCSSSSENRQQQISLALSWFKSWIKSRFFGRLMGPNITIGMPSKQCTLARRVFVTNLKYSSCTTVGCLRYRTVLIYRTNLNLNL